MQPPVLSAVERQRLESMLRVPQMFGGTPHAVVDENLKRAEQVLKHSMESEQAVRTTAQLSEAAVRKVLSGTPEHSAKVSELEAEVSREIQKLIAQIEAVLAQAGKS